MSRRPLVDDHATLQRDPAEAAGERRRLDGRRARHERALPEDGRANPQRDLVAGERLPAIGVTETAARVDRLGPGAVLRPRRTGEQEPVVSIGSVYAICCRPSADRFDRFVDCPDEADGSVIAETRDETRQLVPPAADETTVPSGRSAAADVSLQDDDPSARRQLREAKGRPQT